MRRARTTTALSVSLLGAVGLPLLFFVFLPAAARPQAAGSQETAAPPDPPDIRSVEADLTVPPMSEGEAAPGKRVKEILPGYEKTQVYHALYLPDDWQRGGEYPVIVEYAGNGDYRNQYGDQCTGRPERSKLGYGISAGRGFLWVCLPYLDGKGTANVINWWGDPPAHDARPTVEYAKKAVPWICERYGGDPGKVILAGFSRGAIACNHIGLYDDEIARLWRAFVPYSHYDGVVEGWGYAGGDRAAALRRLERLKGRPQFICHEVLPAGSSRSPLAGPSRASSASPAAR